MTFRVGQKVVCIEAPDAPVEFPYRDHPKRDAVYTVRGFRNDRSLYLAEIINDIGDSGTECGFRITRFRPIVDRKTDIGFAHEILRKVSRKDRVSA